MSTDYPLDDQERFEDYDVCQACDGFGNIEKSAPRWDDPYFCETFQCAECNGSGWVLR